MSVDAHGFVAWEEHIICHERGSRVVHYYLKDGFGDLLLAIIGTERSIRHMTYVLSDEFLEAYGSNGSINASTKWRARREVVELLSSMVSRHKNNAQINGLSDAGSFEVNMKGFAACKICLPDNMVSRKFKAQNSDIVWSGVSWICTKQLKHYTAFCRNRTTIAVHAFVLIMAEEESHHLGYLEDLYEDKKAQKKVKVRWFHHNQEVKCVFPQLNPHPREVFITPHVQVISADCVDGLATVLTPRHYEKYAAFRCPTLSNVYMCFRQFKNNKVKPFALTKLHGYSNQAILYPSGSPIVPKKKFRCHNLNKEDEQQLTHDDLVRGSAKRNRSSKEPERLESGSGLGNFPPVNQMEQCETTYPKLRLRFSRKTKGIKFVVPESECSPPFNVDEKVELLCQDSGIRGCWFSCRILQASQKHLKVRYDDVLDMERSGNLEEWVLACRVASPDKLGMRRTGRHTIRPCPLMDSTSCLLGVGAPVDAWWCDGWWEGVVCGVGISGNDFLQVYLPGEDKVVTVQQKNARTSRDWVNNRWVDVKAKPNILSYLPANIIYNMKIRAPECGSSSSRKCKVVTSSKLDAIEEDEPLSGSLVSAGLENVKEVISTQKPQIIGEGETEVELPLEEELESINQKSEAAKVVELASFSV